MAEQMQVDPIDLRLANLLPPHSRTISDSELHPMECGSPRESTRGIGMGFEVSTNATR